MIAYDAIEGSKIQEYTNKKKHYEEYKKTGYREYELIKSMRPVSYQKMPKQLAQVVREYEKNGEVLPSELVDEVIKIDKQLMTIEERREVFEFNFHKHRASNNKRPISMVTLYIRDKDRREKIDYLIEAIEEQERYDEIDSAYSMTWRVAKEDEYKKEFNEYLKMATNGVGKWW